MKGATKTLAVIALTLLLVIAPTSALALQTITVSGGKLNNHIPTVYDIADEKPTWTAIVSSNLRWSKNNSSFGIDFIYSSNGLIQADEGGINAYEQDGGWFQYVKVQLKVDGSVKIYFMPNSTIPDSTSTIYLGDVGTWESGSTEQYPEPTTVIGCDVFISVGNNKLYIGSVDGSNITYWVKGFGLSTDGLGKQGATHIGAYGATYTVGGVTTACTEGGAGFVQVEFGGSNFIVTQSMQDIIGVMIAVIPIIVMVAVMGMILNVLKGIGKK